MQSGKNDVGNGRKCVAVVAMQGDFEKHISMLQGLGRGCVHARGRRLRSIVRTAIIPSRAAQSTTIGKLLARYGVDEAIKRAADQGKPIYGTCAGMILLARDIAAGTGERGGQPTLGLLDIAVQRNAFGRQVDSFEADLDMPVV